MSEVAGRMAIQVGAHVPAEEPRRRGRAAGRRAGRAAGQGGRYRRRRGRASNAARDGRGPACRRDGARHQLGPRWRSWTTSSCGRVQTALSNRGRGRRGGAARPTWSSARVLIPGAQRPKLVRRGDAQADEARLGAGGRGHRPGRLLRDRQADHPRRPDLRRRRRHPLLRGQHAGRRAAHLAPWP